jgi:transducin (beta)-like 1
MCEQPFSVLYKHECKIKAKRKLFDPEGMIFGFEFAMLTCIVPIFEDFGSLEMSKAFTNVLQGHQGVVGTCEWNPKGNFLATASSDGMLRLWRPSSLVFDGPSAANDANNNSILKTTSAKTIADCIVLELEEKDKVPTVPESNEAEILAISWSNDGKSLASGTLGGDLFVWDVSVKKSNYHKVGSLDPITCVKFNTSSSAVLCTLSTGKSLVYSRNLDQELKSYSLHEGLISCADWRDEFIFATAGSDQNIVVCDYRDQEPVRIFSGHEGEINMVQWDPNKQVLASASDDKTIKIWDLDSERPMYDFQEHGREVTSLSWSSIQAILASASLDSTVRLWDIQTGSCVRILDKHVHPVSLVKYSPDGKSIASVSNDRIFLWNSDSGALLRTFKSPSGINDISWEANSSFVSLACANQTAVVLDLRI